MLLFLGGDTHRFFDIGPSRAPSVPFCYCTPDGFQQHSPLSPWLQSWPQHDLWHLCELFVLPARATMSLPQRPQCLLRHTLHLLPALSRVHTFADRYKTTKIPRCLVPKPVPCCARFRWSSGTPQRQNVPICGALCYVCMDVPACCLGQAFIMSSR